MLLFVSFAADDSESAKLIALALRDQELEICSRRDIGGSGTVSGDIEQHIQAADAFIAIMSPSYLASAACRRERVLALQREAEELANGAPPFIYVITVSDTPYLDTGAFRARSWLDLTAADDIDGPLERFGHTLVLSPSRETSSRGTPPGHPPVFRNRKTELDQIIDDLTSPAGEHFWQVIAPPHLGKSWLLDRIDIRLEAEGTGQWTVRLVDVREKTHELRTDVKALLGMFFGVAAPDTIDENGAKELAGRLNGAGKFHLCLLDSAELLDRQTATSLRKFLSQVHKELTDWPRKDVSLALIVASRTQRGWTGISPKPTLRKKALSEFKRDVIAEAMQEMSQDAGFDYSEERINSSAIRVQLLCEGLPALLHRYLTWLQQNNWTGMDRLLAKRQFDQLTQPYIEGELLSADSLFEPGAGRTEEERRCVIEALRFLVPYRFYTQGHFIRNGGISSLQPFLEPTGWTMQKLLEEMEYIALLDKQGQPWDAIHPPIRRLLCRYWYPTDESLAHAHLAAMQFFREWCKDQDGYELATALVECVWHESQVLALNRANDPEQRMLLLIQEICGTFKESVGWTIAKLREHSAEQLNDDAELVEALEQIGVRVENLMATVRGSRP